MHSARTRRRVAVRPVCAFRAGDVRDGRGGGWRRYEVLIRLGCLVLRTWALRPRRLPRTASPPPAATGPRRNVPRCDAMRSCVRHRRVRRSPSERSAHRGGTPRIVRVGSSSLNGGWHPANAGRAFGAPWTPETSADPAGLTARARPQARPDRRAANLRKGRDIPGSPASGSSLICLKFGVNMR